MSMAIVMNDRKDGDFHLEIESISAIRTAKFSEPLKWMRE